MGMGVPEHVHGHTGTEIEISLPVLRNEIDSFSVGECDIGSGVGGENGGHGGLLETSEMEKAATSLRPYYARIIE
jgi:hypothetical protein